MQIIARVEYRDPQQSALAVSYFYVTEVRAQC